MGEKHLNTKEIFEKEWKYREEIERRFMEAREQGQSVPLFEVDNGTIIYATPNGHLSI